MRIISQDGSIDIEYGRSTLLASDKGCLYATTPEHSRLLLAKYPSIEIACNVMGAVRTRFIDGWPAYRLPFYKGD